jgi:hypothetical protein
MGVVERLGRRLGSVGSPGSVVYPIVMVGLEPTTHQTNGLIRPAITIWENSQDRSPASNAPSAISLIHAQLQRV